MTRGTRMLAVTAVLAAATGCGGGEERRGARGTVGYTVTPPRGWEDITRDVEQDSGVSFDVAYGGPTVAGSRVNLNIASREAGGDDTLATLIDDGRREVDELVDGRLELSPPVRTEVDGAPAMRYDFEANGRTVRQVGTLHEGGYFVVTLTAPTRVFRRSVARLDGLLRSWQWD